MRAMLVRESSKTHLEFDLAEAAKLFRFGAAKKTLEGELVTSPFDLYAVETLRDRHKLKTGKAFPTDIFVFGKGEPDNPSCTKVGGRPFWPADCEWPCSADGSPYYFLAQFNFADSLDIVGDRLPSTVLLLLADSERDWMWEDSGLSFHWVSANSTPATNLDVPSAIGAAGPFYGAIHRSADYPDSHDAARRLKIGAAYNLPVLNGTKIGGLPHFIQSGADFDGQFLCQLGSIQAEPDVPFPWINRQEPLGVARNSDGINEKENCAVFGDMGSIYLFLDDHGNVRPHFESY